MGEWTVNHDQPMIPIEKAHIFFDGTFTKPRLDHPEGLAIEPDGSILCGGEEGQIFRIDADGKSIKQIASTGGFALGLALDGDDRLFICDLKHTAIFRLDLETLHLALFARGPRIPNFPVVDRRRGVLYVSDSHQQGLPGPGVWRFDLNSGEGGLWYGGALHFANGMALSPDGNALYVVESFAQRVVRIPIKPDGTAGELEVVAEGVGRVPDGLAFDRLGNLYISCYEPSGIYRLDTQGRLELLIIDPEAHTLCHPTNCAFRGTDLFTANLGRWHITRMPVGIEGLTLPVS